jgi:phage tail-like protein
VRKGFAADDGQSTSTAPAASYTDCGAVTLGSLLPAVYQEFDENTLRFTAALDHVLAPVWLSIDCFDSYLHPGLTPDDMAAWLAGWVGVIVDDNWHADLLRRLVANAFELYRWRGTAKGIADLVEAYTGLRPTVDDSGAVSVSTTAGTREGPMFGSTVSVRFSNSALTADDTERLTRFVQASVPVHVQARVEIG